MQKDEMHAILSVELVTFTQVIVSPQYSKGWHLHFADADANQFAAALHQAVIQNTTGFPPSPGQVAACLKAITATPEELETCDEAWENAWHGRECSPRAQEAARLMGDWEKRKMWLLDSLPFKRKDFNRIYESLKQRDNQLGVKAGASRMLNGNESNVLRRLGL